MVVLDLSFLKFDRMFARQHHLTISAKIISGSGYKLSIASPAFKFYCYSYFGYFDAYYISLYL